MSMVLTRSPLEAIAMNGAGVSKRRSARLSAEGADEKEPPAKKTRTTTTRVETKDENGSSGAATRKKKRVYDEEIDGFAFTKNKSKRTKGTSAVSKTSSEQVSLGPPVVSGALLAPTDEAAPKTARKTGRRRLPTTPERDAADQPTRRSKRLSSENQHSAKRRSPHKPAHVQSHANHERSPSPRNVRPLTNEKKRRQGTEGAEPEKVTRIQLPFADTPVIKRNKEMRKASANTGNRRSSSGMRGRRASSMIDEGRGNAIPHSEVPSTEFFKHISAGLTEPRRMRCLLGWCGTRALPPKPDVPPNKPSAEQRAQQVARVIQDELSQDLITKGILSDWFSRDDSAPPRVPLRKCPNPRNVANAAKAEELERELERLKRERAEWDELIGSVSHDPFSTTKDVESDGTLSPLHPELLDSPQRAIAQQLQQQPNAPPADPVAVCQRLDTLSGNLEFTVDQFAHGVDALRTSKDTAERLADRSLTQVAGALERREQARRADGKALDPMEALRGLARVLNAPRR